MARDYTKYNVGGLGENLNKRKLVFTIVKNYVEKNNPSFEELQNAFPDEVQGSKGFIRKEANVKAPRHFNMREPLKIKNGAHVVVSNQWGKNIDEFIASAEKLGYSINVNSNESKTDSNGSESFSLSNEIFLIDIRDHIEETIKSGDNERCKRFKKSVIDFVNLNHASYWIIPFTIDCLNYFQNKSDDENLEWDEIISLMHVAGKELDFNPKKKYSLYYDSFNEGFTEDEDTGESESFFKLIMRLHFNSSSNFNELSAEESNLFINTSITSLYCTISKVCEDHIRQDELVDLLLHILDDQYMAKFEAGDLVWDIIQETLTAFGLDLEEYENDENLWRDLYKYNFDDIASHLVDNDVFDNDYIPS